MINCAEETSESWLVGILNRVVRCPHRNHGRPITPRGGGQSYAVCLDCGKRFAYNLSAMRVETSVSGSSLDRHLSEREEEIPDIPEPGLIPSAPARRETMWNDSLWRRRDVGTAVVLCLGAMTLAFAFFYSGNRSSGAKHLAAAEQARPPLPVDSAKSSPGLSVQHSRTEIEEAPESAAIATPTIPTQPEPITEQKKVESDSASAPTTTPPSNRVLRLEGKGSVIVLGRKAVAAVELAQHPEMLRKLIRRGALFTVPRGTPIKLVQGNWLKNRAVVKVRLMAGSKAGQEGWAQSWQISP